MAQQLIYTSAPSGLNPGSRGFTVVAATQGMLPPLTARLESLSGYRLAYNVSDPRAKDNPVAYSHIRLSVGGQTYSVLSRIAAAGVDYSGRSNALAHHLVLDPSELAPAGPAAMLASDGLLMHAWSGNPRWLPGRINVAVPEDPPTPCSAWQEATGDAGWAGTLAAAVMQESRQPIYIVYPAGFNLLPLFREVIALLPPAKRWQCTFSTYFQNDSPDAQCLWRGVLAETAEAALAAKAGGQAVDLTRRLGAPPASDAADAARSGVQISAPAASPAPRAKAPRSAVRVPASVTPAQAQVLGVGDLNYEPQSQTSRQATIALHREPKRSSASFMVGAAAGFVIATLLMMTLWQTLLRAPSTTERDLGAKLADAQREIADLQAAARRQPQLAESAGGQNQPVLFQNEPSEDAQKTPVPSTEPPSAISASDTATPRAVPTNVENKQSPPISDTKASTKTAAVVAVSATNVPASPPPPAPMPLGSFSLKQDEHGPLGELTSIRYEPPNIRLPFCVEATAIPPSQRDVVLQTGDDELGIYTGGRAQRILHGTLRAESDGATTTVTWIAAGQNQFKIAVRARTGKWYILHNWSPKPQTIALNSDQTVTGIRFPQKGWNPDGEGGYKFELKLSDHVDVSIRLRRHSRGYHAMLERSSFDNLIQKCNTARTELTSTKYAPDSQRSVIMDNIRNAKTHRDAVKAALEKATAANQDKTETEKAFRQAQQVVTRIEHALECFDDVVRLSSQIATCTTALPVQIAAAVLEAMDDEGVVTTQYKFRLSP